MSASRAVQTLCVEGAAANDKRLSCKSHLDNPSLAQVRGREAVEHLVKRDGKLGFACPDVLGATLQSAGHCQIGDLNRVSIRSYEIALIGCAPQGAYRGGGAFVIRRCYSVSQPWRHPCHGREV